MKSKFTGLILAAVLLFGSVGLVGCRPGGSSTVDEYTPNLDVDYEITETLKVGITADAREKELIEGIRFIDREKGWSVRVVPKNDLKGFRVVAEAASSETAEEICDFYLKKIRSDKNSVDKSE